MSQITTKWIADDAITAAKLDSSGDFVIHSMNTTGDTTVGGNFSVIGTSSLTGTMTLIDATVIRGLKVGTDATVTGGLYIDKNASVNGNVGVGTTTPSAKLAINGGVHVGGDSNPGNDNLTVDGQITTGGTVGILNTSPNYSLDVGSNTYAASALIGINSAANQQAGFIIQSAGTSKWEIFRPANSNDLRIYDSVGTADRVTVQSGTGYVGVGTTNPIELFQVGTESSGASARKVIKLGSGGNAAPTGYLISSNGDKIVLYSSAVDSFDARIGVGSDDDMWFKASGATSSVGKFKWFSGSTPTERMRIDSNGQVGIGTTSPAAQLAINGGVHVGGDSDPGDNNLLVDGEIFTGGNVGVLNSSPNFTLDVGNNTLAANSYTNVNSAANREAGFNIQAAGISKWQIYRPVSSNDLRISDTAFDRVTVQSSTGNVGVGTTSPTNKVQISIPDGPTFSGSLLHLNQGYYGTYDYARLTMGVGGVYHAQITSGSSVGAGNNNPGFLSIKTADNAAVLQTRIFINELGNVGIGTTSMVAKLSINGGVHVGGDSDPGDNNLTVDGNTYVNGQITTGSTVGILNTSPNFSLDVGSNAYASSAIVNVNSAANQQAGFNIQNAGTSRWYIYRPASSDDLRFWETSDRVTIQYSTGNVGVGTLTPSAKLAINGGLHVGGDSDPGDNNLLVDGNAQVLGTLTAGSISFSTLNVTSDATVGQTLRSLDSTVVRNFAVEGDAALSILYADPGTGTAAGNDTIGPFFAGTPLALTHQHLTSAVTSLTIGSPSKVENVDYRVDRIAGTITPFFTQFTTGPLTYQYFTGPKTVTVTGDTSVSHDVSVGNKLLVSNDTTVNGFMQMGGNARVTGILYTSDITSSTDIRSLLDATIVRNFAVEGDASITIMHVDPGTGSTPATDSGIGPFFQGNPIALVHQNLTPALTLLQIGSTSYPENVYYTVDRINGTMTPLTTLLSTGNFTYQYNTGARTVTISGDATVAGNLVANNLVINTNASIGGIVRASDMSTNIFRVLQDATVVRSFAVEGDSTLGIMGIFPGTGSSPATDSGIGPLFLNTPVTLAHQHLTPASTLLQIGSTSYYEYSSYVVDRINGVMTPIVTLPLSLANFTYQYYTGAKTVAITGDMSTSNNVYANNGLYAATQANIADIELVTVTGNTQIINERFPAAGYSFPPYPVTSTITLNHRKISANTVTMTVWTSSNGGQVYTEGVNFTVDRVNGVCNLTTAPTDTYSSGWYAIVSYYTILGQVLVNGRVQIAGEKYNQLDLVEPCTPTGTSDSNGSTGSFAWDENYLYVKTAGGWRRIPYGATW